MRQISLNLLKNKVELQAFYFDGFKHFLTQFAIIIYGKTQRNSAKFLSPSQSI